jgi:hypothetical protein
MKWIAIIAVCLAVVLYGLNALNRAENRAEVGLEQREDGLYYKTGAKTVFTGDGLVDHPNGEKAQEGKIEAGKQTGPWKIWHANGQLHWEGSYKDGKKEGAWTRFDEEGVKTKESTWEEGVEQVMFELKPVKPAESPAAPTEQKQNE